MVNKIRVADEVWIVTALLHRQHPDQPDFSVGEIVRQARQVQVCGPGALRPGVQVHAYLHCVANKAPNPGRYRILVETRTGQRRLYRPGDPCHPLRSTGKRIPQRSEIPSAYIELIDWYHARYVGGHDRTIDPIVSLRGLGRTIWSDEQADAYVSRLREDW